MSVTPTPLAPVTVAFENAAFEAEMKRIKEAIEKLGRDLEGLDPTIQKVCVGIALTGPAGLSLAVQCYAIYKGTFMVLPPMVDIFNDINQWVWAPKNLLDMADALAPVYNHATDCKQALIREAMPADRYWEGEAVDAYYAHITKHNTAAGDAEAVVKSLKEGLSNAGQAGMIATYAALAAIIQALIEALIGLIALIPPATPIGAGLITLALTLLGATVAALVVFAQASVSTVEGAKSEIDGKLRSNNFPGGKWPQPSSHSIRSDIQDVGGWSYE